MATPDAISPNISKLAHTHPSGSSGRSVVSGCIEALAQHPFPGNVRELENVLERALALSDGTLIQAGDLHLPSARPAAGAARITGTQPAAGAPATGQVPSGALPDYIEQLEREAIIKKLEQSRYNKTRARAKLGTTFRAMRYKLKKLGID